MFPAGGIGPVIIQQLTSLNYPCIPTTKVADYILVLLLGEYGEIVHGEKRGTLFCFNSPCVCLTSWQISAYSDVCMRRCWAGFHQSISPLSIRIISPLPEASMEQSRDTDSIRCSVLGRSAAANAVTPAVT